MKIRIKVEGLPWHFLLLGSLLIIYSIFDLTISRSYIVDPILFLVGLLLVSSQQQVMIDPGKKTYCDYYWVFGLQLSKDCQSLQEISVIICLSGNYREEYGKVQRIHISGIMYKGYILLKNQEKLFVGQDKNKDDLMKKLTKIGSQLNAPVEDRAS